MEEKVTHEISDQGFGVGDFDLNTYILIFKRRWKSASFTLALTVALALASFFSQKPTYKSSSTILIQTDVSSRLAGFDELSRTALQTLPGRNNPIDNQIELLRSRSIVETVISDLNLVDGEGKLIKPEDFLVRLDVKPIIRTDSISVTFVSQSPEESAAVVNKLVDVFARTNIFETKAQAQTALNFLEKQIPLTRARLSQAEENLKNFREDNNIVNIEAESGKVVEALTSIERQASGTQAELAEINSQLIFLGNELGLGADQASALISLGESNGVQSLLSDYQSLQQQLSLARTQYEEVHPEVQNLLRKVQSTEDLLNERVIETVEGQNLSNNASGSNLEINSLQIEFSKELLRKELSRLALEARLDSLNRERQAFQQRAAGIPKKIQQQVELEREIDVNRITFEELLRNNQQLELAINQTIGNVRVISPAVPPVEKYAPSGSKHLAAGIILGSFLAAIVAVLLDTIDPSIKTIRDIKLILNYTQLALIPQFKANSLGSRVSLGEGLPIFGRDFRNSYMFEVYQSLYTNLKFMGVGSESKAICISSSVPSEGKSSTAANLAATAAYSGRKVLLIDCDMRKPTQHELWDLGGRTGLSNVLIGECSFETAVHHGVFEGLDVLTAGVRPPNPIVLLESNNLSALIQNAREKYDLIIVDTPPINSVADALELRGIVDGLLLVVRPHQADIASLNLSRDLLARSAYNIFGLVVNGIRTEVDPESYNYSGYGYGYGYGYGGKQRDLNQEKDTDTVKS